MKEVKASIITIGDELLIGQTIDTNSAWMGKELTAAGFSLMRRVAVGDLEEEVLKALDKELEDVDIVLLTGGLGPTEDDKTKAILCTYFDAELVWNERVFEMVQERLLRVHVPILETNRAQALVPDKAVALLNERGTAPGLWFEKEGKVVVAMPGIPYEMKGLMEKEVIPRLLTHFEHPSILYKTMITTGIAESTLAKKLENFEQSLPAHIGLAYLPGGGMLKLRLTGKSEHRAELETDLTALFDRLRKLVEGYLVIDADVYLPKIVGDKLREQQATVATAESCTGGLISHLLTSVPGSSSYFTGALITYSNELKRRLLDVPTAVLEEKGAVSEEVVKAMVKGVLKKLGTHYAVAVSGIMGPGGGSEEKPVGTVWLAAGHSGKIMTRKLQLRYDRTKNTELTANYALLLLLKLLKE